MDGGEPPFIIWLAGPNHASDKRDQPSLANRCRAKLFIVDPLLLELWHGSCCCICPMLRGLFSFSSTGSFPISKYFYVRCCLLGRNLFCSRLSETPAFWQTVTSRSSSDRSFSPEAWVGSRNCQNRSPAETEHRRKDLSFGRDSSSSQYCEQKRSTRMMLMPKKHCSIRVRSTIY